MPPEENNATIPKTRVKSAIFEPSRVPSPSSGSPLIAETIEIVASGRTEIKAMIKKLTINSGRWRTFAILEEYFIAKPEHFISTIRKIRNKSKLTITMRFIAQAFF